MRVSGLDLVKGIVQLQPVQRILGVGGFSVLQEMSSRFAHIAFAGVEQVVFIASEGVPANLFDVFVLVQRGKTEKSHCLFGGHDEGSGC